MSKDADLEVLLQLQRQLEPGAASPQQLQQVRPQPQHVVAPRTHTLHVVVSAGTHTCYNRIIENTNKMD